MAHVVHMFPEVLLLINAITPSDSSLRAAYYHKVIDGVTEVNHWFRRPLRDD